MGDEQTPSMNPVDVMYRWAQDVGPPGDPRRIPMIRAALDCVADVPFMGVDRDLVETIRRYADGSATIRDVDDAKWQLRTSLMSPAEALAILVYGIRPWEDVHWIFKIKGEAHCAQILSKHTGMEVSADAPSNVLTGWGLLFAQLAQVQR